MGDFKKSTKLVMVGLVVLLGAGSLVGGLAYTKNAGVFDEEKVDSYLIVNSEHIVQYTKDTQSLDFTDVIVDLENTNENLDYSLKVEYVIDGKTEFATIDVLAGGDGSLKIPLFDKTLINGAGVYTQNFTVKKGDVVLKTVNVDFIIDTTMINKADNVRVNELVVAENKADSEIIYFDYDNAKTIDTIVVTEANTSKIVVTGSSFALEELNANKFAKLNINYELAGSVIKNELYEDGFALTFTVTYEDDTTVVKTITEDFVNTNALEGYVEKSDKTFSDLTLTN